MSTLNPVDCPFVCGACDAKSSAGAALGLCGRCKAIRYCVGKNCQREDLQAHQKVCVTAGDEAYYADPNIADLPVYPWELSLRDDPRLLDERFDEIIFLAEEAREEYELTCPTAKGTEEMEQEDMIVMVAPKLVLTDAVLCEAMSWHIHGRKAEELGHQSKEDMLELMRREVYQRLRFVKDSEFIGGVWTCFQVRLFNPADERIVKALNILQQSILLKASYLRKLAWDDPGLLPRGLRERLHVCKKRDAEVVASIAYQTGVLCCDNIKIDWLVDSFLLRYKDAMTAECDYLSFFTQDNEVEDERIRKIVAILLALKVEGIDEGVFWEIKDRQDKRKLQANMDAYGLRSMIQPWDRRVVRLIGNGRSMLHS